MSLEGALSSERESLGTMRTKLAAAKSAMESRVAAMQQELTLAKEVRLGRHGLSLAEIASPHPPLALTHPPPHW